MTLFLQLIIAVVVFILLWEYGIPQLPVKFVRLACIILVVVAAFWLLNLGGII